jgi:hypothetical protein
MVVVVVLSAFNVHQHAAQIRDLFAWGRPSGAIAATTPGAAASAPANGDAAQATTTANVRILPIGQGTTRPISPTVVDVQAPAAPGRAAEPPAPSAAHPPGQPTTPARPTSTEAAKMPAAAPAPRPAAEARKAPAAAAATASVADAAAKDAKGRSPPKPVAATAADAERPAAQPSAAEADRCRPELVALGLCNRNPSAKEQR